MELKLAYINIRYLTVLDFLSQFFIQLTDAPAAGRAHIVLPVKGKHGDKEQAEAVVLLIRFQSAVPSAAGADDCLSEIQLLMTVVHAENKKHTLSLFLF